MTQDSNRQIIYLSCMYITQVLNSWKPFSGVAKSSVINAKAIKPATAFLKYT